MSIEVDKLIEVLKEPAELFKVRNDLGAEIAALREQVITLQGQVAELVLVLKDTRAWVSQLDRRTVGSLK